MQGQSDAGTIWCMKWQSDAGTIWCRNDLMQELSDAGTIWCRDNLMYGELKQQVFFFYYLHGLRTKVSDWEMHDSLDTEFPGNKFWDSWEKSGNWKGMQSAAHMSAMWAQARAALRKVMSAQSEYCLYFAQKIKDLGHKILTYHLWNVSAKIK